MIKIVLMKCSFLHFTLFLLFVADRMIDWIKQGIEKVVPQPEIHVRTKTDEKTEAPASAKGAFNSSAYIY